MTTPFSRLTSTLTSVSLHGVNIIFVTCDVRDARRGNFMASLFCWDYINHEKVYHRSFLCSMLDYTRTLSLVEELANQTMVGNGSFTNGILIKGFQD